MKTMRYILLTMLTGLTAAMLGSCADDDGRAVGEPTGIVADDAIVLGVSAVRSHETRAQQTGIMTFTTLRSTGFGVYGYKGTYNSSTSEPTLFKVGDGKGANTKVTFVSVGTEPTTNLDIPGSWDYTNATTANLREWEKNERYTFFAYAPYMTSGDAAPGITSVKTDDTKGDPTVGYTVATNPTQSVDLLWGVRSDTGLPWTDIQQDSTHSAVLFTFYHALCALGLHAQVMVDQENDLDNLGDLSQLGTIGKEDGCKVTLKSITITPAGTPAKGETPAVAAKPFHRSAVLNLNNRTDAPPTNNAHQPLWTDHSGTIASLILDDGLTEGHGAIESTLLDPKPNDFYEDPSADPLEINLHPTNTDVMTNSGVPGITEAANTQAIIAGDKLFMLIPQEAQDYTVSVDYFLTYKTTGTSYHREAITGTATIKNLTLAAGVKYYLNLVFGLTTFKLTVNAVDWDEQTAPVTIATETGTSAGHSLSRRSAEFF